MHGHHAEWTPSDVATVIIAIVAVVVSVASVVSTFLIHRLQGAVVKIKVRFHADLRDKATYVANAPDPDAQPRNLATTSLRNAAEVFDRFPEEKYYATSFLRVIVTNAGRLDAGVDSITYVNKEGKGIAVRQASDPPYPVMLPAQTYLTRDYLYSELRSHSGLQSKIRFIIELTNGKRVKSGWVQMEERLSKPH